MVGAGLAGSVGVGVLPGGAELVGSVLAESVGVGWAVTVVVGDGIAVSVGVALASGDGEGDGLGPPMTVAPVVCLARGTQTATLGTRKPPMSTTPR